MPFTRGPGTIYYVMQSKGLVHECSWRNKYSEESDNMVYIGNAIAVPPNIQWSSTEVCLSGKMKCGSKEIKVTMLLKVMLKKREQHQQTDYYRCEFDEMMIHAKW